MALVPANYQQFLAIRRQQFALREQERSPQYEKLLADLKGSIAEWEAWRSRHPGPGTMAVLRAQAVWLAPLIATVANPVLLGSPWLYGALGLANRAGPLLGPFRDQWMVNVAVRQIQR